MIDSPEKAAMSAPDYLTAEQVDNLLQVSVKSFSRWAMIDPSMPVLRVGRTVRFHRERLLRWLRQREQGLGQAKRSNKLVHAVGEPVETNGQSFTEGGLCARL